MRKGGEEARWAQDEIADLSVLHRSDSEQGFGRTFRGHVVRPMGRRLVDRRRGNEHAPTLRFVEARQRVGHRRADEGHRFTDVRMDAPEGGTVDP